MGKNGLVSISRIKHFKKSGARLYIPQKMLVDANFPFADDDIIKIEIVNDTLTLSKPLWWEMVNWNQMKPTFEALPEETKVLIRERGLDPE